VLGSGLFSSHSISLVLVSEKTKPHLSLEMGFCFCISFNPPSKGSEKAKEKITPAQAHGPQNLSLNPNSLSLSSLIQDKKSVGKRTRTNHIEK
jgi:hypothetical protein